MAFHAPSMAQPQTTAAGSSIQSHLFMQATVLSLGAFGVLQL
jgi:hypothetical protein